MSSDLLDRKQAQSFQHLVRLEGISTDPIVKQASRTGYRNQLLLREAPSPASHHQQNGNLAVLKDVDPPVQQERGREFNQDFRNTWDGVLKGLTQMPCADLVKK